MRHRPLIALTWLNLVPALLSMMGLGCLSLGLIQRANSRSATTPREPAAASAAKDPQELQRQLDTLEQKTAALAQQRDSLKDKLDAISQQAAHNQLLLSLLLGFAGLFTLAQGVFAFFSAQSYVKQADDALARIETLADEVRRKYPMFSQIEDAREAAFGRLARLADRLNLDQNLYQESDPITRQEILALESFAATQFLASPGREKEVIANLRLLGKFYADKFVSGKRTVESDFERALYYFTLECDKSNRDTCALNDLGWLYMEVAATKDPDRARALDIESLRINPNQQRPNYNLGTMIFDPGDPVKLAEARKYLEKALSVANWEKAPNEEFSGHVSYNLSCTYSRLAQHEGDPAKESALLDLAAGALDAAAANGGTKEETLEDDLKRGDLKALADSPAHSPLMAAIRKKFREAWAARAARH
jgi:hypothetical protein